MFERVKRGIVAAFVLVFSIYLEYSIKCDNFNIASSLAYEEMCPLDAVHRRFSSKYKKKLNPFKQSEKKPTHTSETKGIVISILIHTFHNMLWPRAH